MAKIATIGLACDCQSAEQPVDKVFGRYPTLPWFWRGSDLKFRLCFYDGGVLYDESLLQSVTLEIKEMVNSDGILYPPDPDTAPLIQGTITSFTDISGQDEPIYEQDDGVQAVLSFMADQTDTVLVHGWLSIIGTTLAGEVITFAAGKIECKEDGFSSGLTPSPLPAGNPIRFMASEDIAAGHVVNIYQGTGGTFYARNAKPDDGYEPSGFVLVAVASGDTASVYFSGVNTAATGLSAGTVFLSTATAGLATSTVPTGNGKIVQPIGYATSATSYVHEIGTPIVG